MSLNTAPIFATRYISAICVSALFYDHLLTLEREILLVWLNSLAGMWNRFGFIVNRYLTEAVAIYVGYLYSGVGQGITNEISCQASVWIFTICNSLFIAVSYFLIMWRVYTLWDRRPFIKWILLGVFFVSMIIAVVFGILCAIQMQASVSSNPVIRMCTLTQKPWGLKYTLAALTGFDLFIIVMSIINALDKPHKRQADVMTSLQHDGARMFVRRLMASFPVVLRLISLIIAIVGNETNFFGAILISWSMCSIASSRIQLRVESLRFYRLTTPLFLETHDHESRWELDAF
ncbi:hypothetical protein R3P38DRAFT_2838845 [Favolaschia claudopus]|uniref:DUF6533 domain-containing protein n=1 Tax=Favolaschia claudopus TaxID=2862362 RepID=A0AAW0E7Z1_9AGAR